jgi:hypothetical protein
MDNYLEACRKAEKWSKENGPDQIWAVVFHLTLGYLAYAKRETEPFPEECIHFKNGFEIWRKERKS